MALQVKCVYKYRCLLIQYFEQCVVVNRAYIGMLLVEGLWSCLSVAPGFPDKMYISS